MASVTLSDPAAIAVAVIGFAGQIAVALIAAYTMARKERHSRRADLGKLASPCLAHVRTFIKRVDYELADMVLVTLPDEPELKELRSTFSHQWALLADELDLVISSSPSRSFARLCSLLSSHVQCLWRYEISSHSRYGEINAYNYKKMAWRALSDAEDWIHNRGRLRRTYHNLLRIAEGEWAATIHAYPPAGWVDPSGADRIWERTIGRFRRSRHSDA